MIKNLRKDIFIYIYIYSLTIVSTLENFIPTEAKRNSSCLPSPAPSFPVFYPLIVKLTKRAGELSRRNGRGGEDYANRPIIICAQLVGARTICLLNGRSSAKSNGN